MRENRPFLSYPPLFINILISGIFKQVGFTDLTFIPVTWIRAAFLEIYANPGQQRTLSLLMISDSLKVA